MSPRKAVCYDDNGRPMEIPKRCPKCGYKTVRVGNGHTRRVYCGSRATALGFVFIKCEWERSVFYPMADRTIQLGFDPVEHFGYWWANDDEARTLWLLWRPGHIVSEGFETYCCHIADVIRRNKPKTPMELIKCFPALSDYWTPGDVERFATGALPYFTGEKSIGWEYVKR